MGKKLLVTLPILIYFLVFFTLSVLKHYSLHSTYLDLGLESQIVWNTSQGRILETSFGSNGETISALSFHVSPISALLAPLYWIWPDPVALLFLQTSALALGGLSVFWLALKIIGSRLLALAFLVSYLLYPPLQYSNLSDFHPQTLATPILLFAFWCLVNNDWRRFFVFMVLGLITKENVSSAFAVLGFYTFFQLRKRKIGFLISLASLVWFLGSVSFVMPLFSHGGLGSLGRYEYLGKNPLEILFNLVSKPFSTVKLLLEPPKVKLLLKMLAPLGFLSLLSPVSLLPAVPELMINLLSSHSPQWQIKFHYTAAITPFVFIAAIYGFSRLDYFLRSITVIRSIVKRTGIDVQKLGALALVGISLMMNHLQSPSPISRTFDPSLYRKTPQTAEVLEELKKIPDGASVSAMNNLGSHLSTRRFLYRFPIGYESADFVVFDPKMPYENFDLAQVTAEEFESLLRGLRDNKNYLQTVDFEKLAVFERIKQ